jgi:hypothetical protein
MRTQKHSDQVVKFYILILILVLIIHSAYSKGKQYFYEELLSNQNKTEKFNHKNIPEITHEEKQIQSLFSNDDCLFVSTLGILV